MVRVWSICLSSRQKECPPKARHPAHATMQYLNFGQIADPGRGSSETDLDLPLDWVRTETVPGQGVLLSSAKQHETRLHSKLAFISTSSSGHQADPKFDIQRYKIPREAKKKTF